jgi:thioredoxin reductase
MLYDIIIIGAGPAGLTAAINTSHRGLKTLVLEQYEKPGGQPLIFYPDKIIKDHPGFPIGILAKEFARRIEMQAVNSGAEIKCNEEALNITPNGKELSVKTANGIYQSKRVIICTGLLNIPNKIPIISGYTGDGVTYKLGNLNDYKEKAIAIIGGGDTAFDTSLQLRDVTDKVWIVLPHEYAKASEKTVKEAKNAGIKILYNTELVSIENPKKVEKIKIKNKKTNNESEFSTDIIFSATGFLSANEFFKRNAIELNADGTVKVDNNYETSVKNVFAAGDLNGEAKLIAVACARGIQAAIKTFSSIKKPYWIN